jgi:hypothetical protein
MKGNQYSKTLPWIAVSVIIIAVIIMIILFYSTGTPAGVSDTGISENTDRISVIGIPDALEGSTNPGDTGRNIAPQAQVIQSSPTQSGRGVENVLPEHPNATGLVFTGPLPYTFTLRLGYATNIHRIEILWENSTSIANEYRIDDVDYYGRFFKKIIAKKNMSGDRHIIYIPDNQSSSFLKFSFNNATSRNSPKITQIRIFADGPDEYQAIVMNSTDYNRIFLSKNDPENPLRIFRVPIRYPMVNLANRILAGESNLTDHQKIVKFLRAMNTFKDGIAPNPSPETIFAERIGACGSMSNVLLSLAATQNISGRMINMMNYPQNKGHSVSEYYINGKWQLYDSFYGGYYTNTPDDTMSPYVLSFQELRSGGGRDKNVIFSTVTPILFKNNYRNRSSFLGYSVYENANPAGPIGPEYPFVFPLKMDLKNESSILIGPDSSLYRQGSRYIGAATMNIHQIWTITSLVPGQEYRFIITPNYIWEDTPSDVFSASAHILDGGSIQKSSSAEHTFFSHELEPWEIGFIAENRTVQIRITHPYGGNNFHYLAIKKYEIVPGNNTLKSLSWQNTLLNGISGTFQTGRL